jgi:membrane-associated phospholipid phosphatase
MQLNLPSVSLLTCLGAALLALWPGRFALAGDEADFANSVTDIGTPVYLGGAVVLPFVLDGADGEGQALRAADAMVCASLATRALKGLTQEERPDGNGHDSFPSEHAAVPFAAATIAAEFHPEDAAYWYGGAALIAWSRVRLNRHRVREVAAGALLGYGLAKLELELPRGVLMVPFVNPTGDGAGVELQFKF